MGKPDTAKPPEPEPPWPIDPRPAIRDLMEIWDHMRKPPPMRYRPSREPKWAVLGMIILFSILAVNYWIDRYRHPPVPRQYISAEKLSKVELGMSRKEVLEILGEPRGKSPDCWSYDLSDDQLVCIHLGSMFKVAKIETAKKRTPDSSR